MTATVDGRLKAVLRRAAMRATRAPSVHNTQPWRMHIAPGELTLFGDRERQLKVLDPSGRQLIISCGCALMNARISIAAQGVKAFVERLPDSARPELLARIGVDGASELDAALFAALDHVIDLRQTNRREFADELVPTEVMDDLERAAQTEGALLHVISSEDDRLAVARLSQHADQLEVLDPAYRAELREWTTDDPRRLDGVQAYSVPHVGEPSQDELPIRDFDTHGMGWLPSRTRSSHRQTLALLCTDADNPHSWLCAGEALQRVLLEITRHGFVASPMTQVIEVPSTRAGLRSELRLTAFPHVLLRIGHAPAMSPTPRRHITDVVTEVG